MKAIKDSKIVLISTRSEGGGAFAAAYRTLLALIGIGINAHMLSATQEKRRDSVTPFYKSIFSKLLYRFVAGISKILEKVLKQSHIKSYYTFETFRIGLRKNDLVKTADILHLHWISGGFLSVGSIGALTNLKKPVVWTLHDMWLMTGGCHYSGVCENFKSACGNCFYLRLKGDRDYSNRILQKKLRLWKGLDLYIITPSRWLADVLKESSLYRKLKIKDVKVIPNCLDVSVFSPCPKQEARASLRLPQEKFIILFIAHNVDDKRKGFYFLKEALKQMVTEIPTAVQNVELVLIGRPAKDQSLFSDVPCGYRYAGVLSSESRLALYYNAADIMAMPSLEDNLPNTIMESMACGTPCIAFNTGGIGEMIDHEINGYLAETKNIEEFAAGLKWIYESNLDKKQDISKNAREKTEQEYSPRIHAERHEAFYGTILNSDK